MDPDELSKTLHHYILDEDLLAVRGMEVLPNWNIDSYNGWLQDLFQHGSLELVQTILAQYQTVGLVPAPVVHLPADYNQLDQLLHVLTPLIYSYFHSMAMKTTRKDNRSKLWNYQQKLDQPFDPQTILDKCPTHMAQAINETIWLHNKSQAHVFHTDYIQKCLHNTAQKLIQQPHLMFGDQIILKNDCYRIIQAAIKKATKETTQECRTFEYPPSEVMQYVSQRAGESVPIFQQLIEMGIQDISGCMQLALDNQNYQLAKHLLQLPPPDEEQEIWATFRNMFRLRFCLVKLCLLWRMKRVKKKWHLNWSNKKSCRWHLMMDLPVNLQRAIILLI